MPLLLVHAAVQRKFLSGIPDVNCTRVLALRDQCKTLRSTLQSCGCGVVVFLLYALAQEIDSLNLKIDGRGVDSPGYRRFALTFPSSSL